MNIVIADDHEVFRIGLRTLLKKSEDIKIVGEGADGKAAVDLVQTLQPDAALIDILMPEMTGIEAVRCIKESNTDVKVIMLTSLEDKFHLSKAMAAGADGYLSKEIGRDGLVDALHAVHGGERVFSSTILEIISNPDGVPYFSDEFSLTNVNVYLSKREQEILALIAEGLTSKEIAEKLYISPRTVETHRTNLMQKLQIKNTAGLIRFALLNLS